MNLRSLWSGGLGPVNDKPTSDALEYITKRINLIWLRQHTADGGHQFPSGLWTPTIGGTGGESGQVYAQQDGFWIKADGLVHVGCRVQLSTLGTITGVVQIKGLPFTSLNASGYRATATVVWTTTTTAYVSMAGTVADNATAITLVATAAATTTLGTQFVVQGDLTNTTRFILSIEYEADT